VRIGVIEKEPTIQNSAGLKKPPHPTHQILVESAQECLRRHPRDEVTVEMVLDQCGVSRSSLYHHFEDFSALLEQAIAESIAAVTRQAIEDFHALVETCQSAAELRQRIFAIGRILQSRDRAPFRMQRLVALAATDRNDRYRLAMAREHQALNRGYQDLIEAAQEKGWIDPKVDALAVSLFIQAYTFGRVLDDVSMEPFDEGRWNALIEQVLDPLLFGHSSELP
jgi:AcrR family transcriptional regulator